jgi:hypothetical protein
MSRPAGAVAGLVLVVLWLCVALGLVAVLGFERLALDDDNCPVPGVASLYGEAEWQTWPPGEVCRLGDSTFSEPPAYRAWLIVVEVAVGIVLLVLWRLRRDAPDPDWTA